MALSTPTVASAITTGHILRGDVALIFFPTCANIAAPTSAELSAGTDYRKQVNAFSGFEPAGSTVDFGNAGSRLIGNVPGTVALGTGTVGFNLSKTGSGDARSVIVDGTDGVSSPSSGYWAVMPEGNVSGGKMRVFAATCTKAAPSSDLDAVSSLNTEWALQAASGIIAVPTA